MILLLNGLALFQQELALVTLQRHFPDYKGETGEAVCQYVQEKFLAQNHDIGRRIFTKLVDIPCDGYDNGTIRFVID